MRAVGTGPDCRLKYLRLTKRRAPVPQQGRRSYRMIYIRREGHAGISGRGAGNIRMDLRITGEQVEAAAQGGTGRGASGHECQSGLRHAGAGGSADEQRHRLHRGGAFRAGLAWSGADRGGDPGPAGPPQRTNADRRRPHPRRPVQQRLHLPRSRPGCDRCARSPHHRRHDDRSRPYPRCRRPEPP